MKDDKNINIIRKAALKFLAKREYGQVELHEKISRNFENTDHVHSVCQNLVAEGLLSDQRFAEDFINHQLIITKNGPRKIAQQLTQKHIPKDILTTALASSFSADLQESRIRDIVNIKILHKKNQDKLLSLKDKEKLFQCILNKGYDADIIHSVIQDINV